MRKTITTEYLRALDEKFEEAIIVNLDLSGKGFSATGEIGKCLSLVVLNISKNSLTGVEGIAGLPCLKFLNISFNNIKDIAPLNQCPNLIRIDALANAISDLRSVTALESLASLKVLQLQTITKEDNNPVCKEMGYRQAVLKGLSKLSRLDFLPRGIQEFEQVGQEEDVKIDLSGLRVSAGDLYGDFGELERALNEAKKAEIRADSSSNKIGDLQASCKKKQSQTEEALRELERMLG